MLRKRIYRIGRWGDYIANPHTRKPPTGPGKAAHRLDLFWKRTLLFLIVFIFWLGLGIGPSWSIVAAFISMGLVIRYSLTRRSVKLIARGKKTWQVVRGQPEAAAFNHRYLALTGVGVMLLFLSGVLHGPWTWYYGALGVLNLLISLLVLWLRSRILPQTG